MVGNLEKCRVLNWIMISLIMKCENWAAFSSMMKCLRSVVGVKDNEILSKFEVDLNTLPVSAVIVSSI